MRPPFSSCARPLLNRQNRITITEVIVLQTVCEAFRSRVGYSDTLRQCRRAFRPPDVMTQNPATLGLYGFDCPTLYYRFCCGSVSVLFGAVTRSRFSALVVFRFGHRIFSLASGVGYRRATRGKCWAHPVVVPLRADGMYCARASRAPFKIVFMVSLYYCDLAWLGSPGLVG